VKTVLFFFSGLENDVFNSGGVLKSSRKRNSKYSQLLDEIKDLCMEKKELME
jgi:hypothetical protein